MNKKGQVTLFVIIAILIVVAIGLVIVFRGELSTESIPENVVPIKARLMECFENDVSLGVNYLESNGGFMENPDFVPGTRLSPSSSQLSFGGLEIPYWSYFSGSNDLKTQIPTKESMEKDLANFINEKISKCTFEEFRDAGYIIDMENPKTTVSISDDYIDVDLNMDFSVERGDSSSLLQEHTLRYNSKLGELFNQAKNAYEKEQSELFLEERGVDILRLYAPVDGVELTCSPKVWSAQSVYGDLVDALEYNHMAMKNKGPADDYFVVDLPEDVDAKFVYSKNWPTYFEVNPTEDGMMISKPMGNQKGMGILGLCYVPYHYVYNLKYPVLTRLEMDGEIFQFPMIVSIQGNLPREARKVEGLEPEEEIDICGFGNTNMTINIFDEDLNPVDGNVSFECLNSQCDLGESDNGALTALFPQCVNGKLRVKSDGFMDTEITQSIVDEGSLTIMLNKKYERDLKLDFDKDLSDSQAIVTFTSPEYSTTIMYPSQKNVEIGPGTYDVNVLIYSKSEIKFPETTREDCYTVPSWGILGMAGFTKKECVTNVVPEQTLETALIGGGSSTVTLSDKMFRNTDELIVSGKSFETPKSLDDMQQNYILVETSEVEVSLK